MKVELIENPGTEWENAERELDARGTPLSLYHRAAWARAIAAESSSFFVAVRDDHDRCRAGFAVESSRSRALPGHRLLSILRLGIGIGGLDDEALRMAIDTLRSTISRDRLALRVSVDVYGLDAGARSRTGRTLRDAGFARVPTTRNYERTLLLDLSPSEDALFAALHKNARQGVRNIGKFPVRLSTAGSVAIADRLQELSDETRERTGGEHRPIDWRSFIEMSNAVPDRSRIAVLERTDIIGPSSIIAFAWGCAHGDVAEYSESGSVRVSDMKISTSYALLWDLITWARRGGARTFDLGGVTVGNTASDDPLGGISDFKRRFSQHEAEVGEQWELVSAPFRAAVAAAVSRSATFVRSGLGRFRR
ncbi:MAG TPA: GNAT family N-acetyltransferase [Gemmatimonadaceae bacterium]|nr:GNAT family N-acetyltransferase [Gemmatimonadaceae bacterium]